MHKMRFSSLRVTTILLGILSVFPPFLVAQSGSSQSCFTGKYVSDQEILDKINNIIDSNDSNLDKYNIILCLCLELKEQRRSGPDSLFRKTPNWYWALKPYLDNLDYVAALGLYKNQKLTFLTQYNHSRKYEAFSSYMKSLNYLDKEGLPQKRKIAASDKDNIRDYAKSLFCD